MPEDTQKEQKHRAEARWVFTGLRSIEIGDDNEVELNDSFSLVRPNEFLLSARDHYGMNGREFAEAAEASRYLVYRRTPSFLDPPEPYGKDSEAIQNALVCFQIIKPVRTLGFTFHGWDRGTSCLSTELSERRPPMVPGQWARMRRFDLQLVREVPAMIEKIRKVMEGSNVEHKNAVILLQLGLETNDWHQLLAGLLWVMGLEAIFDTGNRNEFRKAICDCLGGATRVFPDWNHPIIPPGYTVEELATPIYMLRSKLAHGADLRTAALDKTTPVDLLKRVKSVDGFGESLNAHLLSEAACYLLCQVIQKAL
jgi:hypothetical protein